MADKMFCASNFVTLLFAILPFSPKSESANVTAVITKPPSPLYALEGQNSTLEWTYTVDGSVGFAKFAIINDDGSELAFWKRFSSGGITFKPGYQERFKVEVSDTKAELTILSVQRSDEETYKFNIDPTGDGSILEEVILVVNFPPKITEISEYQTVTEGGNVTLKCLADGKPTPNITWRRLSDNKIANMPLTDITRQHTGKYNCTANNGIGSPAIEDAWIDVQYPVEAKDFGENKTVVQGGNETFSCPVDGVPKPNITWFRSSKVSETPIFIGEKFEATETGCYTCVASNSLGTSISITQCLTVEESSTASITPPSVQEGLSRVVIGVVVGVAVFVVIMTGLVTCWVCKKKKCRKNSESGDLQYVEVDQRNN